MADISQVIRLETRGPDGIGLQKMQLDPADFQSDLPEQFEHVYFADETVGLTVGVWTTTSMQEAFGQYPGDEFMWVLEGQVAMVDVNGKETPVLPGESFCIRNAIPISWKQRGFLRKFFMIYLDPRQAIPEITSAEGGIHVLRADEVQSGMQVIEQDETSLVQHENIVFTNDSGNMHVGMWDSTEFTGSMEPFAWHEMVQLLEGEVTITEANGCAQKFVPGDAFFIPKGTVCQWQTRGLVKKYFCILE